MLSKLDTSPKPLPKRQQNIERLVVKSGMNLDCGPNVDGAHSSHVRLRSIGRLIDIPRALDLLKDTAGILEENLQCAQRCRSS